MVGVPDRVVRAYIHEHGKRFVDELAEWVAIPSISAEPAHAGDVRASAEWLAGKLQEVGFPTVEVWETEVLPAVFAEWSSGDPQAPAVVVYGHHDVQPVDPVELWDSPPFQPVVRGDRLIGRGAADDKGQVFFRTLGVRAHLAATKRSAPAVNLKLIVEGEEESGSPHFAELLRTRRNRLACGSGAGRAVARQYPHRHQVRPVRPRCRRRPRHPHRPVRARCALRSGLLGL